MSRHVIHGALASILLFGGAQAAPVETSLRPSLRPADARISRASAEVVVALAAAQQAPQASIRPTLRPETVPAMVDVPSDIPNPGFDAWVREFRSRALAAGVDGALFDRAFRNARFDPDVIRRDSNQAEFTRSIWDYLDSAASESRIGNGRDALRRYGPTLERIEARYGVDKEVVAAIWGMESAYGTHRGSMSIVNSLATLSYEGRRGAFFEEQLIAALKILQNGDTTPEAMTGSWAGAMGHTQFIPTSYEALAVDFDGDGRRDIWSDDPTDALASTAAYLARYGWIKGMPWGVEVRLPRGFRLFRGRQADPEDAERLGEVRRRRHGRQAGPRFRHGVRPAARRSKRRRLPDLQELLRHLAV